MTSAITADAVSTWEHSKRFRRLREVGRLLGLVSADAGAFLVADLLIRWDQRVPVLVFFPGRLPTVHSPQIDVFLLLAVLFVGVRAFAGDYSNRLLFWDGARLTTKTLIIASVPDFFFLAIGNGLYSPLAITASWLFLIVAVPVFRQFSRAAMSRLGIWRIPSALVGDGSRASDIHNALSTSLSLGFDIRTVISTRKDGAPLATLSGLDHVAASDGGDAVRRAVYASCEQAVIVVDDLQSTEFANIVESFLEADIAVAIVPSLRRLPVVGLNTSHFFGRDILLLQVRNNLYQWPRRLFKRTFDIAGALLLLLLFSPLFAAIAVAIKRCDGGPIFYKHKRVGRNDTPFDCLKFRTMTINADRDMACWRDASPDLYEEFLKSFKLREDPRVTAPGKWLRRTSLDELPQLINVLRGEMSLVGPRPVVKQELNDYYGSAAQLYCRVRPGMTGLWQVSGRSTTSYRERVTYDEWYILNWTFWYDIVILLQTAWSVIIRKGAF